MVREELFSNLMGQGCWESLPCCPGRRLRTVEIRLNHLPTGQVPQASKKDRAPGFGVWKVGPGTAQVGQRQRSRAEGFQPSHGKLHQVFAFPVFDSTPNGKTNCFWPNRSVKPLGVYIVFICSSPQAAKGRVPPLPRRGSRPGTYIQYIHKKYGGFDPPPPSPQLPNYPIPQLANSPTPQLPNWQGRFSPLGPTRSSLVPNKCGISNFGACNLDGAVRGSEPF